MGSKKKQEKHKNQKRTPDPQSLRALISTHWRSIMKIFALGAIVIVLVMLLVFAALLGVSVALIGAVRGENETLTIGTYILAGTFVVGIIGTVPMLVGKAQLGAFRRLLKVLISLF